MQEEVKAVRTIKQFVDWYEKNLANTTLPASLAFNLNDFYIKFKYIIKQEDEDSERMAKFLG